MRNRYFGYLRLSFIGLFLLMFWACSNKEDQETDKKIKLHEVATSYPLNLEDGYQTNVLTGDSIEPFINSYGIEIITGKPFVIKGDIIDSKTLKNPVREKLDKPKKIRALSNISVLPKNIKATPIDKEKLKSQKITEKSEGDLIINSIGDTLITGVPRSIIGKKVSSLKPIPVPALPLRMKDNAIGDIQYLDVGQGLNSSYQWDLLEDSNGNIWIASDMGGVSIYNGSSFTHYTTKEGLSHNVVSCLIEDRNGNFWFGTAGGGLNFFDGKTFTHFTEKEGLSNNYIYDILEDKNGDIWINTENGVNVLNGETLRIYSEKEGLASNETSTIYQDSRDNIWIGTASGLSLFDGDSFTNFDVDNGLVGDIVLSVIEDRKGDLWIGTMSGLSRFDGESFLNYSEENGLDLGVIRSLLEDKSGQIWIGSNRLGIYVFDGKVFKKYSESTGLTSNNINKMMEDSKGNIWISCWSAGIVKIDPNSFKQFKNPADNLMDFQMEDTNGDLWFSNVNGYITKYDGEFFYEYTFKDNTRINELHRDQKGRLWISTEGNGMYVIDGDYYTLYGEEEGLSSNYVNYIHEKKDGVLWFGTDNGLTKLEDNIFTHFTENEGFPNNNVSLITEDKNSVLWFSSLGGGAVSYDGDFFTIYTEKEGLVSNDVRSIVIDNQNNKWFGTTEFGLSRFDGKSITHYQEKEGLANDIIWCFLQDKSGEFWVGTEKGLTRLIFENGVPISSNSDAENMELEQALTILNYTNLDGLNAIDFGFNDSYQMSNDQIWWRTGKGLLYLDPKDFSPSTTPPKIKLTQLEIEGMPLDERSAEELDANNIPKDLELAYQFDHLTFHFAGIDWAAPHKIRYSYKMEGLNDDWTTPSTETKADYRNLPSGNYSFLVRAFGESKEWSETNTYNFTVNPPLWLTWWAYLIYFMVIATAIRYYIVWRSSKLTRENQILETKVANRTKQLNESLESLKTTQGQLIQSEKLASLGELTAGIAHEIQNPLNFVNNFSELSNELIEDLTDALKNHPELENDLEVKDLLNDVEQNLTKINHHGNRASSIVRGMLEHSKSGAGQKELVDINVLADEYLRLAYHGLRAKDKSFQSDFQTNFDDSLGKLKVIPQDLGRVVLNLINNAFYTVNEKSKKIKDFKPLVTISTRRTSGEGEENEQITIIIKDNGNGISNEVKDKIFQPFFTTKPTGKGTGLGLSLAYDIITKGHGGELNLESEVGVGSEFIISLPNVDHP